MGGGETLAWHAGWAELTSAVYTGDRPAFTPGTIAAGAVDNSAAKASFTITGADTIYGALLCDAASGTPGTLTASIDTIPLPARFRDPVKFFFTPDGTSAKYTPRFKPLDQVLDEWSYDSAGVRVNSRPRSWAVSGTVMQLSSPADLNYPWSLHYYQAMPALSTATASATNVLTDRYPVMFDAACTFQAYEFLRNEKEKVYWRAVAQREIDEANRRADQAYAGSDLTMEVD